MRQRTVVFVLGVVASFVVALAATGHAPSGAIFTTLPDGSEVNFNIYADKNDVYLDGGPGNGAPQTAAGLDGGIYVFMVTDPSGKVLLSTDNARCRQFEVSGGIITGVAPAGGCAHVTGTDLDHSAVTVQLMPFNDTPNPGGVYKAWVTPLSDFPVACLDSVDCSVPKTKHGFIPRHSKTDNFKVGPFVPTEIDTRFFDAASGQILDGRFITWIDTLGASNVKWSYFDPAHFVNHEAHVEAPEAGIHQIVIENQSGCTVGDVYLAGSNLKNHGPQAVAVRLSRMDAMSDLTIFIDVYCTSTE